MKHDVTKVVCLVAISVLAFVALCLVLSVIQCSVVTRELEVAQDEVGEARESVAVARRAVDEAEAARSRLEAKLGEVEATLGNLRENHRELRAESERVAAGIRELESAVGDSFDGVGGLGSSLEEILGILDATISFLESYADPNGDTGG